MNTRFRLLCLLLVWTILSACKSSKDILGELETRDGNVDRDHSASVGAWQSAPVKSEFRVGDGIRTGQRSSARLRLSDHSALSLDSDTLIRFLAKPPGANAQGLDLQSGQAELVVGAEPMQLDIGLGVAQVHAGTRLRLSKTERGTRFSVLIGAAELDGSPAVHAGESLEIGIGRAIIERSPPTPASVSSAPPAPPGSSLPVPAEPSTEATADADAGVPKDSAARTQNRGPERIDFAAAAGQSLVIHDPRPPTAIGFSTGKCSGTALLQLGQGHKSDTIGEATVHASFPAGSNRYRLFCAGTDKAVAEGTVTVLHDAGNRRLPSSPPATRIDTDGRRYTVLYQNLLPQMSVRWPNAPAGSAFALSVRSAGSVQRFSASTPSFSFAPGALREGSHDLWFETGGARSPDTTVIVQFDNAAPTASITAPADGSFAPGSAVSVAGTALPGWTVSVDGQELGQDPQHRFSGQVQSSAGVRALAIRFENPQRGTQYYLRRGSN